MQRSTRTSAALLALILGTTCWATPYFQENSSNTNSQQKQSDKDKKKQSDKDKTKQNQNKDDKDKSNPLFGGSLTLKSSRKTSDSATMGFSGLTPNGEVESKKLKEPLNADDYNKAQQVSFLGVKHSSLKKFIQDGKLNTAPARSATAAPKKG